MNPEGGRIVAAMLLLLFQSMLPLCWAFSPGGVAQINSFRQLTTPTPSLCNNRWQNYRSSSKTVLMAKKTQPAPLPTTDDPFLLLGLDSRNPTTDKQEIKRAYRKRAMQYHPDVLLDQDSTEAEREQASKNFARINAAYEMLTGGTKGNAASSDSSGNSAKTTSGGYNYQPPHRRSSSYSSSSSTRSTNWEDYMPNYSDEDEKYDAGGDSFGAIFSDLLTGAAGAAAGVAGSSVGGGGIFGDFIEFLEGNIDGFESGYDDDRSLSELLNYGSFDDIANEMDETDVLVTSLETKQKSVENDLMQVQADLNLATKFSEKLDLEERIAELKAREKVVKGYLKKGRNRLVRLRERYKELMVEGRGGRGYSSRSSSSQSSASSSYSSSSTGSSSSYRASNPSTPPPSPPPPAPSSSESSDKNWRTEGFSSSYGRSSSGRRSSRGSRRRSARVDEPSESAATDQQQQQQRSASETYNNNRSSADTTNSSASSSGSTSSPPKQYEPWVPPHRRTTSTAEAAAKDKKRLRELQVDDEFEKLKREMGM